MNTIFMHRKVSLGIALLCILLAVVAAKSATLPSGFAETRIATGLDPTGMEIAPDGRIFITIKSGKVMIVKNGTLLATPFLNITVDNFNERGLQSIAFDPNFASNQYVYVYYAVAGGNRNRVSRFTANGDVVVAGSEFILLELNTLAGSIHNGGALFFKDGKLFITTGDGANANNSQSMNTLLGKVLRLNPDGSIPTDNPFYTTATGNNRAIYALGFRNPFKTTIQPGTGKVFLNDVGGGSVEEVNEVLPGRNYGWPMIEGRRTTQTPPANYQDPIYAYDHGQGCAITGGAFYNAPVTQFPSQYIGKYFLQDYCSGWMRVIDSSTGALQETFATNINRPIDVKVASDGSMYYIARSGLGGGSEQDNTSTTNGELWRIQYTGSQAPTISAHPVNVSTTTGGSATFTVGASGSAPLSFQWQRNGVNISGATQSTYTLTGAALSDNNATFRAIVSNPFGSATSNNATLTVTSNTAPVPTINNPTSSYLYTAGTTLSYDGNATDAEDGTLPASAFTWRIDLHHDTHSHPGMAPTSGSKSGTFTISNVAETSHNVWYRIYLTVTDAQGSSVTVFRDIFPRKADVTLATNPAGLRINLDGAAVTTPYTFTGVAGVLRSIEATSPQTVNGTTYYFNSWSDSGAAQHELTTPSSNTTYTATFSTTPGPCTAPVIVNTVTAPVIDQTIDAVWANAPAGTFNNAIIGTAPSDFVGSRWKAMYDNNNLYVLVEVKDANEFNDSGTSWWDDDVVEIFIDGNNSKGSTYDGLDDFQLGFRYNDAGIKVGGSSVNRTTGIQFAMNLNAAGGYNLEVAIPWSTIGTTPSNGKILGFEIEVDDDDNGAGRDSQMAAFATGPTAYQSPSVFGSVYLRTCGGGGNNPPVANAGADQSLPSGTTSVTLNGNASSDPDGNTLTYAWAKISGPAVTFNNASAISPVVSGLTNGSTYVFQLSVNDGSLTATDQVQVTVAGALPSPWITADIGAVGIAGSASYAGTTFTVNGSGADIWGPADAFRFVYQNVTGDFTVTARAASLTNTDVWAKAGVMIREGIAANARHATAVVTPGNGANFQRRLAVGGESFNTVGPAGTAPHWLRVTRAGSTFTAFSSTNGTTWTTIGSETITMANEVQVGLALTSHNNATLATATFDNVVITPSNPVPVVTNTSLPAGTVNASYSATVTATNNPTSFSANRLPTGLTINTSTGVISGTPTVSGTYTVSLFATNAAGTSAEKQLNIIINPAQVPVINNTSLPSGTVNVAYNVTITATNNPTSFNATGLPAGLTINTTSGVISGTPTATGTFAVSLSASNAAGTGPVKQLNLLINPAQVPVISNTSLPGATVNTSYSVTITASQNPTSFSATGLPPGLVLNTTSGLISGAPTATGTFTVGLSASNSAGTGPVKQLSLVVSGSGGIPVINNTSLAAGSVGSTYTASISATNSPTSFGATGLPPGLTVNTSTGVISGTPIETGTFSIGLSATNASGTGNKTLSLSVAEPAGTATAYRTPAAITVNGALSESGWLVNRAINKNVVGTGNNTATYAVMWDNTNLYVGVRVLDASLFSDSPNMWEDDGVEIYIDPNNNKLTTYDGRDNQIIKNYNKTTVFTKLAITGLQHAWATVSGGFTIEVAIPWTQLGFASAPTAGTKIGFDVAYDDDDNGGTRDAQVVWNGTLNNYQNTSAFGTVVLSSATRTGTARLQTQDVADASGEQESRVTYWPNEVENELHIATDGSFDRADIVDMLGRIQITESLVGKAETTINVTPLFGGIYIVRMTGPNNRYAFRIKKRK